MTRRLPPGACQRLSGRLPGSGRTRPLWNALVRFCCRRVKDNVLKYLPSISGSAFASVTPPYGMLSPTAGLLVFLAWIVVPLAAAAIAIKRRPA